MSDYCDKCEAPLISKNGVILWPVDERSATVTNLCQKCYLQTYSSIRDFIARKALVTGASKGIGAAIADVLYAEGHKVVGTYNKTIRNTSYEMVQFDANAEGFENVNSMYQKARSALGYVDVLVNNLGMRRNPDDSLSGEEFLKRWEESLHVNLASVAALTKIFVQDCLANHREAIVINIASRVGLRGSPRGPEYAAAKAAMINFNQSMAIAYAKNAISFFSISPCWVDTDMADRLSDPKTRTDDIPAGRIATVNDITPLVKFLCNSNPIMMTGQNFNVNGASLF